MFANSLQLTNVLFSYFFTIDTNTIYALNVIFINIFYIIFNKYKLTASGLGF